MIELPKRSRPDIRADINIVPYIDVMLVLLVIFMMTTPIIEQGIDVELPYGESIPAEYLEQPSVISIDADGNYYLNSMTSPGIEEIGDLEPISLQRAVNEVLARKGVFPEMQVFVRGDKNVSYEIVINAVAALKKLNALDKVGFWLENPNK